MATIPSPRFVLIYDGVCRLCDGVVRFVLTRDKGGAQFRFCSLQSRVAEPLLAEAGITQADALQSFVLLDSQGPRRVLRRSDAALAIASALPQPWATLGFLGFCVPRFLRDAIYEFVAARRYSIFGKADDGECLAPTRNVLSRFLDADEIRESQSSKKRKD